MKQICFSKHTFALSTTNLFDATQMCLCVVEEPVPEDPSELLARVVVEHPKKYLSIFLQYWGEPARMPDLSEGKSIEHSKLEFWKNMKVTKLLKAHKSLPGLCAKWAHIALDFAISQNQIPVIFVKPKSNELFDMTVTFIHTVWVCYCAQMNGSPALTSKACKKVCESRIFVFLQCAFALFNAYLFFEIQILCMCVVCVCVSSIERR